jgi:hypothetical protein
MSNASGATIAACVASQSGMVALGFARKPAAFKISINRFNRSLFAPSTSPKGATARFGLIARIKLPSRLPPAKAKPSSTLCLPRTATHSSGPRAVLTMKTIEGDRFCASTGKSSFTWFLRTITKM